ncbi:PEP-CTERM sorting domain-containing protein [Massilia sp. BJB1822]|uniref:PEP-CTERM sorting domain-containing protein n=1 Tax=Massilia sp. BJB1822 TaxID=2744470 RepID=UPI001593ADD3|nr:PEP-CTERM sorting domain-containing protein [Massilia sp. BJB1822]NVD98346.1 PEP-CTERM sorting domain-containing protein [Massilia sp. BJB1822]
MNFPRLLQVLVAAFIALTAGSSVAMPIQVVDVHSPFNPYAPSGPDNPYRGAGTNTINSIYQQTFMAGKTGLLSGMAIYGGRGRFGSYLNQLRIKVGSANGWYSGPWDAELFAPTSGSIFDLTPYNLHINAGDLVMFELGHWGYGIDSGIYLIQHPLVSLMNQQFSSGPPRTYYPPATMNHLSIAFSTYVTTDPDVKPENPSTRIPEPSTISVMLLGMGLLAYVHHRNRRKKS